MVSLIWLAAPISGMVVQPYLGILSDRCKHSWGRRKPFIIIGTVLTATSILALAWAPRILELAFLIFGGNPEGRMSLILKATLAAAWVWALNLSIQPVQMGLRSLIVDTCPLEQQVRASAYASCMNGLGNIVGYAMGSVALPRAMPWLGDTQFEGISGVSVIALVSTVAVTCSIVQEKRYLRPKQAVSGHTGTFAALGEVILSIGKISKRLQRIFLVQFFSWLGWFPFLFYSTT